MPSFNESKAIKSKIFPLLLALNKKEVKTLKSSLSSFSNEKEWAKILLYLLQLHPNYDLKSKKLEQRYLFKKVFGKVEFNYNRLVKQLHEAQLYLKKQMVFQAIEKDEALFNLLLAKEYQNRGLKVHFDLLEKRNKALKKTIKNEWYFLEKMMWDYLVYYENESPKLLQNNEYLSSAVENLSAFFIGSSLKFKSEMISRQQIRNDETPSSLVLEIEEYCKANEAVLPIFHQFYWLVCQLLTSKKIGTFKKLEALFFQHRTAIAKVDQLIILTYLLNFSSEKIRVNDKPFLEKARSLYKYGIDHNIFTINERFVSSHFLNIIYINSLFNEFEWIEDFLANLGDNLENWIDADTLNVGLARLAFAKQDYKKTIHHLDKIHHKNYLQKIREQPLRIACCFEEKKFDEVITLCKAFRKYLDQHFQDHNQNAIGGKQFISIVIQLTKANPPIKVINKLLQNAGYLVFQEWLDEKIKQIK